MNCYEIYVSGHEDYRPILIIDPKEHLSEGSFKELAGGLVNACALDYMEQQTKEKHTDFIDGYDLIDSIIPLLSVELTKISKTIAIVDTYNDRWAMELPNVVKPNVGVNLKGECLYNEPDAESEYYRPEEKKPELMTSDVWKKVIAHNKYARKELHKGNDK